MRGIELLGEVNSFHFEGINLPGTTGFEQAFKTWYASASEGNYCCYMNYLGQNLIIGRKSSNSYGCFIIIGYSNYSNSLIKISNNTWTFESIV